MKKVISAFVALLLLFQTSCKKEKTINTYPIAGLWIGTYSADGMSIPPRFYSLSVFPDGSILTKGDISNGYAYSKGTWTLTGNAFSATITTFTTPTVTQTIHANYSNTGVLTDATWEDQFNT